VREVSHHQARFLGATQEPPISVDLRCYRAAVRAPLHDIRGAQQRLPDVYDPDRYAAAQAFGAALREARSWGVVYDSVRDAGGQCVGIFRPRALGPAVQAEHVALQWNGHAIESWYVKSPLHRL
jgi:RES domain-containing protein